ncbi:Sulfate/thiosulfate import ATP-binding protein CysA [wastewater metagenome]|uniref:Sulfate/thiosulfate import ATP-binding protein CysA n=2 Tax=unclassified sequences TaxID=12908 RepID=A0A5B8RIS5_9ZZZZ|nr:MULTISPECIES: ABC transporter ATP-binding protein [Arhodomonas]MCS4503350.1 ABC transporter ATP-binding protein [Arhodomonas aquaeolei]QEA06965.1 sulfate/thiosulfate import ATP-binding protein CysA [uncultured organism]
MNADSHDALTLQGVSRHFGDVAAVSEVDLTVPRGKLVCFLGPSGCGKTTLLRLIAGLDMPTGGRIELAGRDVTALPAHKRNLGMVFQSLALFPHLSVAENIAYSLRIRGQDKAAQRQRAEELLDLVRLPGVGDRHVSQLSGGQRQRVAIARALALEPELFLLDEPLSALDAKLREEMQVELKLLQQRVGVTTILVTHDQREAMTMADMVVVMRDGEVQQIGTPLEVYRDPANAFVAEFIGTSNLLQGEVVDDTSVRVDGHVLQAARLPAGAAAGTAVTVSVRPEDVHLYAGDEDGPNRLSGTVAFVRDVGQSVELYVDCGGTRITSHVQPRDKPDVHQGQTVTVELPPEACVVLKR